MRADTVILKKDLDNLVGDADIYLMLDIFLGDTVMHLLYTYVIIKLNGGNFPDR